MKTTNHNNFNQIARLVLFLTSYIPLFILIIIRQLNKNKEFLYYDIPSKDSLYCFFSKFGFSSCLVFISLFGLFGLKRLLHNLEINIDNGHNVHIEKITNRNNESIGYIATYIVPFIYTDSSNIIDILTFTFIMILKIGRAHV